MTLPGDDTSSTLAARRRNVDATGISKPGSNSRKYRSRRAARGADASGGIRGVDRRLGAVPLEERSAG